MNRYPQYLPFKIKIYLFSSNNVDYYLTKFGNIDEQWCIDFILPADEYDAILLQDDDDVKQTIKNSSRYKLYKEDLDKVIELIQKYLLLD